MREVSSLLRAHHEVAYTYESIGGGFSGQVNEAELYVKLVPKEKRKFNQQELARVFRKELESLPGMEVAVLPAGGFGGAERPIQIYVRGDQIDELRRISDEVLAVVRKTPGAVEGQSGLEEERPEVRLDVRRDLANEMGIGIGTLSRSLRPALSSEKASTWEDPGGEQHDVVVRLPKESRQSVAQLAAFPIATGVRDPLSGAPSIVRLSQIASITASSSPQKIERRSQKRVVLIDCNYDGRTLTEVSKDIQKGMAGISIPTGYSVTMGGETEQFTETVGYILESLVLGIIFIYLVLASQFGSFLQPFAIMLSLPLSMVGVLLALLLTKGNFNIMSMIGVILLMGLVTKNAILLVDFTNQRRARGSDRRTALIDAGEIRLRPIVMTTLAMIFGMMPLALALGKGAEFRAPMARAVVGGLITSSLLTLVVVPVVYTFFDDFGSAVKRFLTHTEHDSKEKKESGEAAA